MLSFLSPARLARNSGRHPWLAIGMWVVLVAVAIFSTGKMDFNDKQDIEGSDSQKAEQLLTELRGEIAPTEQVVVLSVGANVDDARYKQFVGELTSRIRSTEGVASVTSYYESGDEGLVSKDRLTTVLPVTLKGDINDAEHNVGALLALLKDSQRDGFKAITAGDGSISHDLNKTAETDLQRGEMVGIPAALVVLVLVFGAAVAAGVPIVAGLLGILVSVGVTALISRVFNISSIVINMITMIGLAVGIDYTLFIVERFREERAKGAAKVNAIVTAGDTASRAVLFSGATVVVALAGMLIVPASVFRGLAIGGMLVVVAAVLVALTLLPAVLSLLGDRINWLHLPGRGNRNPEADERGFFARTTDLVIRHPVLAIAGSVALLVAAAAPVVTIHLGNPGLTQMPQDLESVQAFKVLDEKFSAGELAPAHVTLEGNLRSAETQQALETLRTRVARDPEFASVGQIETNAAGTVGNIDIVVNGDPSDEPAREAVARLRGIVADAFDGTGTHAYVGGQSAGTNDYVDTMNRYLPIVIGFVLSLSFVLLTMVFRSIVIPVKAIVMNLLSVGAAYGLIVLVFQHGVGADLLGFQQIDTVAAFLPIFLFAVLFGLSMDYHVFLLSRVQERYHETRDNTASVAHGLRSTAHIITGAAAIMIMVFGGFALGDMVELQQMGFGLAIAVFLDATVVRSVLVPASMEMLGEWNWYLPKWLSWLPTINVESGARPAPHLEPAFGAEFAAAGGD